MVTNTNNCRNSYNTNCSYPVYIRIPLAYRKRDDTSRQRYCYYGGVHYIIYCFMHSNIVTIPPKEIKMSNLKSNEYGRIEKKLELKMELSSDRLFSREFISIGVMGGINENKCDYNLQEATVAMTYAAGTGEYGPEASGKLAVGALAMGKVTETLGTCAVGLGWCPAGWIAGVGAAAAGL